MATSTRRECGFCGSTTDVRPDVIFPSLSLCLTCADDLAVRDSGPPADLPWLCPLCGIGMVDHYRNPRSAHD